MNLQIDPRIVQSVASATQQNPQPNKAKNDKQLRESTREFEAMYIFETYKAMRKSIPESGLIEKSFSTKMFQEMLDMEMARSTASGEGMGLGKAMYEQLKDKI
tara:strand:- start:58 stop:366 length:309 start_codon:yes stop_codon:yes gene_type:complete